MGEAARRRARARSRARGPRAALPLVLAATACANDCPPDEVTASATTTSSSSSATFDTEVASFSETGTVPDGWPQAWLGEYYEDPGFTLGYVHQYPILFLQLENMQIQASGLTIERFSYEIDSESYQWTFSTEYEGDELRVVPPGGEWDVWYPGAERVIFRPGSGCDELVLEVHGLSIPDISVWSTTWRRGRLCVFDTYDDSLSQDEWIVDLCPGSVIGCDG
jgi:hypothetical protein